MISCFLFVIEFAINPLPIVPSADTKLRTRRPKMKTSTYFAFLMASCLIAGLMAAPTETAAVPNGILIDVPVDDETGLVRRPCITSEGLKAWNAMFLSKGPHRRQKRMLPDLDPCDE